MTRPTSSPPGHEIPSDVDGGPPPGGHTRSTPEFDVFAKACPSRPVLEHLTGRWGVLAMAGLLDGPTRFNALRRRIDGVSEKMLAQTLQVLERDGFVHREVQALMPPRVEYRLTELGHDIAVKLLDLVDYLENRMPEILAAQHRDNLPAESL